MNNLLKLLSNNGLESFQLDTMAKATGFKKRNCLLSATDLIVMLLHVCCLDTVSYNSMASTLAQLTERVKMVSRESIFKALQKQELLVYLRQVFGQLLNSDSVTDGLYKQFGRILIHDSTIVRLPQKLFAIFSGVKNGFTQVANARIQVGLELISNTLLHFSIDTYSKNDLNAANELRVKENDLILRDRGYLSIAEIERFNAAGAYFIYRYSHNYNIFHCQTGKPIKLLKYLKASAKSISK